MLGEGHGRPSGSATRRAASRDNGSRGSRLAWERLLTRYERASRARAQAWSAAREAERRADAEAPPPSELSFSMELHGRTVEGRLETEAALRREYGPDAERLIESLRAWREAHAHACDRQRVAEKVAAAERASDAADALRERLMETPAPDADAAAWKLAMLPRISDCIWDFTDPETLASALAGDPGSEATRAVAMVYLDLLQLAGREDEAEALLAAAREA